MFQFLKYANKRFYLAAKHTNLKVKGLQMQNKGTFKSHMNSHCCLPRSQILCLLRTLCLLYLELALRSFASPIIGSFEPEMPENEFGMLRSQRRCSATEAPPPKLHPTPNPDFSANVCLRLFHLMRTRRHSKEIPVRYSSVLKISSFC